MGREHRKDTSVDDIGLKPYTAVQQALDEGFPAGNRNYWKSCYISTVGDECIAALVEHANKAPSPMCVVALEHMMGGAVARVGADDNAFGNREAEYNLLILGISDDVALDDAVRDWARGMWKAVQPFSTGGVYVNYMDADESDRIGAAYGSAHYARLAELKKRYDPDNLFCLNQNIARGGGTLALHLAEAVGSEGRVLCRDIDAGSIEASRARAHEEGFENIDAKKSASAAAGCIFFLGGRRILSAKSTNSTRERTARNAFFRGLIALSCLPTPVRRCFLS